MGLAGKSFVSSLANLSVRADNPLKTMNDRPATDTPSKASESVKSISGQPISIAAPGTTALPTSSLSTFGGGDW